MNRISSLILFNSSLIINLDYNLFFKDHVYEIVKKACKICNIILRSFKNVNNCTLTDLYKYYVRPILEYVSVVWSPHHVYLIDLIENVQRNFIVNDYQGYII